MRDRVSVDVGHLTDLELRLLLNTYEVMAGDEENDPPIREWYRRLGLEIRAVLSTRTLVWLDYVASTGFPSWDMCVSALPERAE
jgi:hypothetical protein